MLSLWERVEDRKKVNRYGLNPVDRQFY